MTRKVCIMVGFLLLLMTGSSSCTRSGLYGWKFHKYKGELVYKIGSLNHQWESFSVSQNDIAFLNRQYYAIIQVNSTCRKDYEDVALHILSDHLFYGFTERKIRKRTKKLIDRRDALYTEITAKLDGVKIIAALLVIKKNSCIYDFTYLTRPWNFGRGIGDFHRVIYGFKVVKQ